MTVSPEESGDDRQGPVETEDQLVVGEGGKAEAGLGQHWVVQRGEQGDVEQRVQAVQPDLNQVAGEKSVFTKHCSTIVLMNVRVFSRQMAFSTC